MSEQTVYRAHAIRNLAYARIIALIASIVREMATYVPTLKLMIEN